LILLASKAKTPLAAKGRALAVSQTGGCDISNRFRKKSRSSPIQKSSHLSTNCPTWTVSRKAKKRLRKRLVGQTQKRVRRRHHWTFN